MTPLRVYTYMCDHMLYTLRYCKHKYYTIYTYMIKPILYISIDKCGYILYNRIHDALVAQLVRAVDS